MIYCSFSWLVWSHCFGFGVSLVFHNDYVSKILQFRMSNVSCPVNDIWSAIWVGVVSEIWKHRNNVIFKRGVADASEVFVMVQVKVCLGVFQNLVLVRFPILVGVWTFWLVWGWFIDVLYENFYFIWLCDFITWYNEDKV